MVQQKYRPEVRCRTCERKTRSPCGRCRECRCVGTGEPGQPTVEEMRAYYAMKMRAIRDCGLNPIKSAAGDVDDVMVRERIPTVAAFLTIYRSDDEGVHVVQAGAGGDPGGRVPGVPGPADAAVEPGDPGELRAGVGSRGGRGAGGATAGDGAAGADAADVGGTAAVLEGGAEARDAEVGVPRERRGGDRVRLTRYWLGVTAGTEAVVTEAGERGGLPFVTVWVRDATLFGRTVRVPAAYTEPT